MSYFVWHDNETPTKAKIIELLLKGYEYDRDVSEAILMPDYPKPEPQEGKYAVEYINPKTKEYIFEYHDIQPTPEEVDRVSIAKIKEELTNLQLALVEMYETASK